LGWDKVENPAKGGEGRVKINQIITLSLILPHQGGGNVRKPQSRASKNSLYQNM
jgi:hypothetical protein